MNEAHMVPAGDMTKRVKSVDAHKVVLTNYTLHLADSVVLTREGKLLLQRKPLYWRNSPGALCLFGGHVEKDEEIMRGLIRELREELGAVIDPKDVHKIGAITEAFTQHKELVHIFFWHDKEGTITGCYEGEAENFSCVDDCLSQQKLMDYARWALIEAKNRNFIS